MRCSLFDEDEPAELMEEIQLILNRGQITNELAYLVCVAEDPSERINGFIEVSIRPRAPLSGGDSIAYVEALFVRPEARRQGIARGLLQMGETWAISKGRAEYWVDTDPKYESAQLLYGAYGFEEVSRSAEEILYRKTL